MQKNQMDTIKSKFEAVYESNRLAIASGFNYFNPLLAVRGKHEEVGLHSKFLFSLLNPEGDHFQGGIFLRKFFESAGIYFEITEIDTAKVTREKDRIDLLIETKNQWVIIENKIYAGDQPAQIQRYIEKVRQKEESRDKKSALIEKPICVVYLTLSGIKPSKKSLGDWVIELNNGDSSHQLILLNYKTVQAWCISCLAQVPESASILRLSFMAYRELLDRLMLNRKSVIVLSEGEAAKPEITTNEDFFISLDAHQKNVILQMIHKKAFSNTGENSWFLRNLIPNGKGVVPDKLIQRALNRLLASFRDGLYNNAAKYGIVVATSRDAFTKKQVTLLEDPVNWYTKNKKRIGKDQFMAFRPNSADDGYWYVIYFATYAFYRGVIKVKGDRLESVGESADFEGRVSRLNGFTRHRHEPFDRSLYSKYVDIAHHDHATFDFKTIDIFSAPEIFFEQYMKPEMELFWGPLENGSPGCYALKRRELDS